MRDPARINKVIEALRAYWLTYPDLRLGQIVANACAFSTPIGTDHTPCPGIFYMEDDKFLEGLKNHILLIEESHK